MAVRKMRKTNLDDKLELATCKSYRDTTTKLWSPTIAEFQDFIHDFPSVRESKDGPGMIIGPCKPKRNDGNLPYATCAVIDADKTLEIKGGTDLHGAPEVGYVHYVLKRWDITHFIYTTHSHNIGYNRYRIIFPIQLKSKEELVYFVNYVIESLQGAGIHIALPKESFTWSQRWTLPVVKSTDSPYETFSHIGQEYTMQWLTGGQPIPQSTTKLPEIARKEDLPNQQHIRYSVIKQFNYYYPITALLDEYGYEFKYENLITLETGGTEIVKRYLSPHSESKSPGVVVFQGPFGEVAYSHHANDPLAVDKAVDSYEANRLLRQMPASDWKFMAAQMVRDRYVDILTRYHPVVMEGSSKFRIMNLYHTALDSIEYAAMDKLAFQQKTEMEWRVPVITDAEDGGRKVEMKTKAEFWLKSEDSMLFNGAMYVPKPLIECVGKRDFNIEREGLKYINLFRGWGMHPTSGKWELLEWHLRNTVCGGNEDQYQYLLKWFAHLFQSPSDKPEVALVLKGKKGTGKSKPFYLLAQALGDNMMVLGNNNLLTGRFNSHAQTKLLLLVEESFWAGHHKEEGVLKHLITDKETTFEDKGKTAIRGRSYARIILITNESWAAPASEDERRFFIPSMTTASYDRDIVNGKKGHFFPALFAEMTSGGVSHFIYDMMNLPISSNDLRNVPETDSLKEQRILSLDALSNWIIAALTRRQFPVTERMSMTTSNLWGPGGMILPDQFVRESAYYFLPHAERARGFDWRLEQRLDEVFGPELCYREGMNRVFGPIEACRKKAIDVMRLPESVFTKNDRSAVQNVSTLDFTSPNPVADQSNPFIEQGITPNKIIPFSQLKNA